jgi:hypothetical protein
VTQRPAVRMQRFDVADQVVKWYRETVHASMLD